MEQKFAGEEQLLNQAPLNFQKGVTKVTERVYFALGYGGSTCTLVVGEDSCILVDTLNSATVAEEVLVEFRKVTDKPINTIIYTHYDHFDHTSGAGAFVNENTVIWGRKPTYPQYGNTKMLKDIYGTRGAKQFGAGLTPEEVISVGIGPRNDINAKKAILPPTKLFAEDKIVMNISGVEVEIVAAPGETDDQVFVWFPQEGVLCCGDNYYASWPNLYAIRGSQYRDVSGWVDVLSNMLTYPAKYLLPGHTKAVMGAERVKEVLTNFRDAIQFVLLSTLEGMNQGKTAAQLVEEVVLPEKWANLPYLQEYYGTVAWSVRAIFSGYLGWFDGNPTNLGFMSNKARGEKTIALAGGAEKLLATIEDAIAQGDNQWAVELCDALLNAQVEVERAKVLKGQTLITMGRQQTSANARHYYIASGKQLLGTGKVASMVGFTETTEKK